MTRTAGLVEGVPALNGAWPDVDIEAPLPHPHLFGLPLNPRWLTAVLLLAAISAALIFGTLWSVLGTRGHFAAAPVFARRAVGEGELPRGDRLAAVPAPESAAAGDNAMLRSRIEQLADGELRPKPFTHVIAGLADLPVAPPQGAPPAEHASPPANVAAAALPPVIRYGGARPAGQQRASAYAAADDGLQGTLAIPLDAINLTVIRKHAQDAAARPQRRVIVARAGDTLDQILTALGVAASDAEAIATLLMPRKWFSRDAFAGGEEVTVLQDAAAAQSPEHAAERVTPPLRPRMVRLARPERPDVAAALSDAGRYVRVAAAPPEPARGSTTATAQRLRPATGASLRDSLLALAQAHDIDRAVVDDVGRLCEHDVDLDAPVGADDKVELLFSPNALGQSELAFAALTLGGKTRRYYRFDSPDDDSSDYYDEDGRSVTKSLLRKPVAAGRLGDGFGWRTHPVLQDRRFHEGVDYAAPMGSPIAAAASGVVEKIDQQWGYGKYIRIRHDYGYETTYAHIAGVPHGLKVGDRVRQGQTIAMIGSTGLSTGPHLYYEVRINGRNVDPLRVKLRAGRVLDGNLLTAFETTRNRTDQLLQASGAPR
ncbi:peptidoglycan DD-metalloendopeptidase family protein [Bradyrhizobium sp. U87765 SZCCT0131]|uniref:peptidoglycan DD-metalloendopeptidase family protein n=1 Tax=unclassified Bradyrhizobium TaxID=2631580 RepID=UPI001BA4EE45|nr:MULTISPECIES: peptidoglycan DD-metalloendopeptidase family protein [unclassified Bradyrhizobium]MBR1219104.1 peptidoglycan DD-metalloendopeptidase family protein [Bradyrhizobium sp. U87765 SZCCT0131]MBR1261755.1 peptidoglycan DD-metalloendopeptidase family protein [Bradyrhizobium sp. U87765 SZCCT0134]MBR1306392.1 peptidoglycan DD-metalloendopeptidase family protein [Bradyrhizobium sp. U87765 SZCCT0110]MBR1317537.1 peptidoglycan DD-metalloendopeptidase family protein [Bradyrhizobium sp. U8776